MGERAAVGAVEAELGDVVAHQLVQLADGEGGDDLLEAELGDVAAHQLVQLAGWEEGEGTQLLYQPFLLQKLSSHTDGSWQAVHVVGDVVGVCHMDAVNMGQGDITLKFDW